MTEHKIIAGVDEAGRGALVGEVVAAAVILPFNYQLLGLDDSKKISASKREQLAKIIRRDALSFAVGTATVAEIERLNILQASLLAMQRAVADLDICASEILVDGNICPQFEQPARAIIGGDGKIAAISAASIVAKVYRDFKMQVLDKKYPNYGFAKHKGYATKQHLHNLATYGACPEHRTGFAPVARVLKQN